MVKNTIEQQSPIIKMLEWHHPRTGKVYICGKAMFQQYPASGNFYIQQHHFAKACINISSDVRYLEKNKKQRTQTMYTLKHYHDELFSERYQIES